MDNSTLVTTMLRLTHNCQGETQQDITVLEYYSDSVPCSSLKPKHWMCSAGATLLVFYLLSICGHADCHSDLWYVDGTLNQNTFNFSETYNINRHSFHNHVYGHWHWFFLFMLVFLFFFFLTSAVWILWYNTLNKAVVKVLFAWWWNMFALKDFWSRWIRSAPPHTFSFRLSRSERKEVV